MNASKVFWWLSAALLAASYVTNGGYFGRLFPRWRNEAAADRTLFLAGAALMLSVVTYLT